jgi:hypothetical protein
MYLCVHYNKNKSDLKKMSGWTLLSWINWRLASTGIKFGYWITLLHWVHSHDFVRPSFSNLVVVLVLPFDILISCNCSVNTWCWHFCFPAINIPILIILFSRFLTMFLWGTWTPENFVLDFHWLSLVELLDVRSIQKCRVLYSKLIYILHKGKSCVNTVRD